MWNQCSNGRVLLRRILQQLAHALSARPVDEAREASDFLGRNSCPEMRIGPCSTGSLIEKATGFSLRIALIAVLSLFPPSPYPHPKARGLSLASAKDLAPTAASVVFRYFPGIFLLRAKQNNSTRHYTVNRRYQCRSRQASLPPLQDLSRKRLRTYQHPSTA